MRLETIHQDSMNDVNQHAAEAAMAAAASKATNVGVAGMGLGWLLSSQAAVLIGMIVGVLGLAINWYYRAKQDRREEREHLARMSELGQ